MSAPIIQNAHHDKHVHPEHPPKSAHSSAKHVNPKDHIFLSTPPELRRHAFSLSLTSTPSTPSMVLQNRVVGAAVVGIILANVLTLNDKESYGSDALKTGGFIFANALVSFLDKSCPTVKHLAQKIAHAGSGFLVIFGGTLGSEYFLQKQEDSFMKVGGKLLLTASWAVGGSLVHYFNHRHYRMEAEQDEEQKSLKHSSHRQQLYSPEEIV